MKTNKTILSLLIVSVSINIILTAFFSISSKNWVEKEEYYQDAIEIETQMKTLAVEELGRISKKYADEDVARKEKIKAYEDIGMYEYLGEFTLTAYCCERYEHICGTGDGITASGLEVKPGMIAVDPDVIPLGSTVIIDGIPYLVADTGGAVKGNHIDIAVPLHSDALSFGIQTGKVWIVRND